MSHKQIYDCFLFFNELELLKVRLDELYESVDYFVICESPVTFQGKAKPLVFEENRLMFERYADKLIHLVIKDMPEGQGEGANWNREYFQRNAMRRALSNLSRDDIVIVSDCDEILRQSAIDYLRSNDGYFTFGMNMYQFFVNMRTSQQWDKVFAFSYFLADQIADYNVHRGAGRSIVEKFPGQGHYLDDSGWHFTFLGGVQRVMEKLRAYSHTDGWFRQMGNQGLLEEQMLALKSVGGGEFLQFCNIDNTFPRAFSNNMKYYMDIGYIKDIKDRLKEHELLSTITERKYIDAINSFNRKLKDLRVLKRALRSAFGDRMDLQPALNGITNLLSASLNFLSEWNQGMQLQIPSISHDVPRLFEGNLVMMHPCDGVTTSVDSNVGYFKSTSIDVGHIYTASCWVWLPTDFCGLSVEISLGEWREQIKTPADPNVTSQWQRVWATAIVPEDAKYANLVLRVVSNSACRIYSTCWQLEEGENPTNYKPTRIGSNLLLGAFDFSNGWASCVQHKQAHIAINNEVPPALEGYAIMCHYRDGSNVTKDGNVGYFVTNDIDAGFIYELSCFVWIPETFAGSLVELSLLSSHEWPGLRRIGADLSKRSCWQKICVVGRAVDEGLVCNAMLRVRSEFPCEVYSTCWSLVEIDGPMPYYTGSGALK